MSRESKAVDLVTRFTALVRDYNMWDWEDICEAVPDLFQIHMDSLLTDKQMLVDFLTSCEDDNEAQELLDEVLAF